MMIFSFQFKANSCNKRILETLIELLF